MFGECALNVCDKSADWECFVRVRGMRGRTSTDEFVLAELELGDQETLRAQANEMVRAHREASGASGLYQAADPTRTVWVTVDRTAKLVDVRIGHNWSSKLTADRFPAALFGAYTTAAQTALLVEAAEQEPRVAAASPFEPIPTGLSEEEWEYRTRALLADTEDQLATIQRAEDAMPTEDTLRGRYGYLTLHLRAGSPMGITADPRALLSADAERLRLDALDVFAQAGFSVVTDADEDSDGDFGFGF
jgi:hypothetical protein